MTNKLARPEDKNRHRFLIVSCFLVVIFAVLSFWILDTTPTYAEGEGGYISGGDSGESSVWQGGSGNGGCATINHYQGAVFCAGVSWVFYEARQATTDTIFFAPYKLRADKKPVAIPGICSQHKGGGFWHYGVNGQSYINNSGYYTWLGSHAESSVWGNNYFIPNASQWGHWMTMYVGIPYVPELLPGEGGRNSGIDHPWNVPEYKDENDYATGNLSHELRGSDNKTIYSATKAALSSDCSVRRDYWKAYNAIHKDSTVDTADCGSLPSIPSGVNFFCYWPGMDKPTYSAKSNISNGVRYDTTGQVKTEDALVNKELPDRTVAVGSTAEIRFSHDIYASSNDTSTTNWRITNYGNGFGNSRVSIERINSPSEQHSGSTTITSKVSDNLYRATNRPFSDGDSTYLSRDAYKLTFSEAGIYNFCQTLYMNNSTLGSEVAVTTVCATYVVKDGGSSGDIDDTQSECSAWTPASYTNSYLQSTNDGVGETSVVSKVRNNTLGGNYTDSVYAKPDDNINWIHCYYPGVQKLADAMASRSPHEPSKYDSPGYYSNYNSLMKNLYGWNNYFNVISDVNSGVNPIRSTFRNPNSTSTGNYRIGTLQLTTYNGGRYAIGVSDIKSLLDNTYSVEYGRNKNKAGETLIETNTSSSPISAKVENDGMSEWKCGYHCSCSCGGCEPIPGEDGGVSGYTDAACCADQSCAHSDNRIFNTCSLNTASSHADVLVPYNFKLTASINLSNNHVYAGEKATIASANVYTQTKYNNTTKGTYATQADNVKVKFAAYLTSTDDSSKPAQANKGSGRGYDICYALSGYETCDQIGEADGNTMNLNGNPKLGSSEGTNAATDSILSILSSEYNVYDATAGKYYCIVAAVYPYTSGIDTQMGADGNNSWYVSSPSCAIIAKKPSIEVWGSGLYSAGKVSVNTAEKRVIDGFVRFTSRDSENTTIFGSWVETDIVANGQVNGLASGAATGFPGTTNRTLASGSKLLSGSKEGDQPNLCKYRSPLTIPSCGSGLPGINISSTTPEDRDALIGRFMSDDGTYIYRNNYTKLSQFITELGTSTIPAGQNRTYVLDAKDKTFTIDTNIQYANNYDNLIDIPKLIIRAGDININCSVTRIDAVLIADRVNSKNSITGIVNTCSDGSDVNNGSRSRQLKINGAVIAGSLKANRTYGAGTGAYSVIPAEIIDYDASLYLWGAPRADASSSGRLDTVYVRELAPRL